MKQKLKTPLIPESGIKLDPSHIMESFVDTNFTRSLVHLFVQSQLGSVRVRGTTDGRIHVAAAGTSMEIYAVENGNAPDAYNAGSTFEFVAAQYVTDILVETNDATISFRNAAGVWGDDKAIPVGFASIDFLHYGVRIQNRVGAAVAAYEITTYY